MNCPLSNGEGPKSQILIIFEIEGRILHIFLNFVVSS